MQIALGACLFLLFWYGVIGAIQADIAPDAALRPTADQLPPGGSVAVGFAARLVDVEINDRAFTPNTPFFLPTAFAHRTAAYQTQVVSTAAAVVDALGSGAAGQGQPIAAAATLLQTPADQWWLNLGWPPIRSSAERAYGRAIILLQQHNALLAATPVAAGSSKGAGLRMPAEATAAVAALASAIEAQVEAGDRLMHATGNGSVAVQLAAARGTAHAAAMLLRGLRDDNAAAVRLSGRAARWASAIDALDAVAAMSPMVAREGDLVRAGYHMLIAAGAMRDILD